MTTLRDIADRIRKRLIPEKKPASPLFQIGDEVEITYKDLPPSTHIGTIIDVVHSTPTEVIYQIEFFPHGPGFGWIQYFDEKDVKITRQRLREMRLEELGI
jgi:hypothetical protein